LFSLVSDYFFKPDSDSPPVEEEVVKKYRTRGTQFPEHVRIPKPFENRGDLGMKRGFLNRHHRGQSTLRNDITDSIDS